MKRRRRSAEQERTLLHQWGRVASGLGAQGAGSGDLAAVVRNGLVPGDRELLVEGAERCIRFLREGRNPFTAAAAPRTRQVPIKSR